MNEIARAEKGTSYKLFNDGSAPYKYTTPTIGSGTAGPDHRMTAIENELANNPADIWTYMIFAHLHRITFTQPEGQWHYLLQSNALCPSVYV